MGHIKEAVANGADVLYGGDDLSDLGGYFIAPTVLEVTNHESEIMTRETFGPEIAIMRVKDETEAIEKANSSSYGLSAAVFSKKKRGQKVARKINAGSVCVNDIMTNYLVADLPFGGVGISGIGRVHGPEGLHGFSQTQAIMVDRFGMKKEPWWYPVGPGIQKLFKTLTRWIYG